MYSLCKDRTIGFRQSDTASVHREMRLYARYSKLPSVGHRRATSSPSWPITHMVRSKQQLQRHPYALASTMYVATLFAMWVGSGVIEYGDDP